MSIHEQDRGDGSLLSASCIASTGQQFCGTVAETNKDFLQAVSHGRVSSGAESNCFRSAQLSADGSTILTYNEDLRMRTYVLPVDLLASHERMQELLPYTTSRPRKVLTSCLYPHYSLVDPSTTLLLAACVDIPISLVNAFDHDYKHATYPWFNQMTEEPITPHSLSFTSNGTRFVAGAKERLAVFDVQRPNEGPVLSFTTRKSKRARAAYGEHETPLGGILSALSASTENDILAVGSTERQVGMWAASGAGEKVTAFSIRDDTEPRIDGCGVMQLAWSSCGNYLVVAERMSDAILVCDVRQGKRLCALTGRRARTMQRMSFDLVTSSDGGCDVWAGGTDGRMRIWRSVANKADLVEPTVEFAAHQGEY